MAAFELTDSPASEGTLVGLGLDVVDIPRFAAVLARRPAMVDRLFSAVEREYADRLARPETTLAGRFAVKEAVMKALGVGIGAVDWRDISVARADGGAPVLTVGGRAAALAAGRGVRSWQVSITHTDDIAAAVVAAIA